MSSIANIATGAYQKGYMSVLNAEATEKENQTGRAAQALGVAGVNAGNQDGNNAAGGLLG